MPDSDHRDLCGIIIAALVTLVVGLFGCLVWVSLA